MMLKYFLHNFAVTIAVESAMHGGDFTESSSYRAK